LGLSQEWKADGVQVLCVCPGPTETAFFKEAGFQEAPLKKGSGQTAEQVAEITLKALARGKSLVTCGLANKVVAGAAGKLPKTWVTWIAATIMRRLRLERYQGS
ncbi:MAG: SDR family NAD(P)-dependent oxidoreductase, partial [Puniceicoccales bacterium]